jgi:ElaB/YqjD/DUF883 family membrane-anchored ribosome-binding protein
MSTMNTSGTSTFKHDLENLSNQAGVVKHDVSRLAHLATDTVRDGASELRDGASHAVDSAKAKLSQATDSAKEHLVQARDSAKEHLVQAKDQAADAAKSARDTIVAHPLTSIGIAMGVGIIAGLLLSRPRG